MMIIGLTIAWVAIVAGAWLGWQLLRQNGRILMRLDELEKRLDELEFGREDEPTGLPLESPAPDFDLPDLSEQHHTLNQYRGESVLLIFFNPACGFCRDLLPKLAAMPLRGSRLQEAQSEMRAAESELDQGLAIPRDRTAINGKHSYKRSLVVIISTGDAETNRRLFKEQRLNCPVLVQKESEVAAAYKANGTPSGYLISGEGKIASGLAMGGEALLEIISEPRSSRRDPNDDLDISAATNRFKSHSLTRSKIKRDGLKAGTPAPDFRLPRLDGRGELSLSELRGQRVLLVFSSPTCGPCNALAPELEEFHREHPNLHVVMISKGESKLNRSKVKEFGLTFPIILQQQWEISRRYAMFATPIAYLIDEDGVIARDVAVGIDAIQMLCSQAANQHERLLTAAT